MARFTTHDASQSQTLIEYEQAARISWGRCDQSFFSATMPAVFREALPGASELPNFRCRLTDALSVSVDQPEDDSKKH